MAALTELGAPRQDNRRRELMDAAAELFSRRGFHATSVRHIAGAVGMLPGSMYYHFASKDDLLLAVYEEGVRRIARHVDAAVAGVDDSWRRLEAAAVAHLEMLLAPSAYARVVIRVLPGDAGVAEPRLIALRDGYEARFHRLLGDIDLPPGTDRALLRLMLLGALNWTRVWHGGESGGLAPGDVARRFVDFLRRPLDGMEHRP